MTAGQRIIAGSTATISWQAVDQDGAPSDPGVTTVAIAGSDGAAVEAAPVTGAGTSPRSVTVLVDTPDILTVSWAGVAGSAVQAVDVAGGRFLSLAEVRAEQASIANTVTYSDDAMRGAIAVVEAMFEQSCRVAFVPRLKVVRREDAVRVPMFRRVRWMADRFTPEGVMAGTWCGVEHGFDSPPADVRRAAILAVRHLLTSGQSQVDFRVTAVVNPDGSRDQLATPGLSLWVTGLPEVDEVLKRYRWPDSGGTFRVEPAAWVR